MILSVIFISKNEELVIKKSLNAAIKACRKIYHDFDFEVILVDSNSIDDTISISQFEFEKLKVINWTIIMYDADLFTASLGRQIGLLYSKGNFVLFLDSDMCLSSSFLSFASTFFQTSNKNVAGLVGKRVDAVYESNFKIIGKKIIPRKINRFSETIHPGGGVYYSKDKIKDISFNIGQQTREEEAFAKQLSAKKRKIRYYDTNMYFHLDYKKSKKKRFINKIKSIILSSRNYSDGIKIHIKNYGLFSAFKEYKDFFNIHYIIPAMLLSFSLFSQNYIFIVLLIITSIFYFYSLRLQVLTTLFFPYFLFFQPVFKNSFYILKVIRKKT